MNDKNNLVSIKDSNNIWHNQTLKTIRYEWNIDRSEYTVYFRTTGNLPDFKIYKRDVINIEHSPTVIDPNLYSIYYKDKHVDNVLYAYKYKRQTYIVFSNNLYHIFDSTGITTVIKDTNSTSGAYLNYMTEVSHFLDGHPQKIDKDRISNEQINETSGVSLTPSIEQLYISDKSVLYKILDREDNCSEEDCEKKIDMNSLIMPFSYNQSQKNAIFAALNNQISVIQGPPGTGKTQTILNIIANLVVQNKTVAVVSSNNEAIRNVQDKLKKYNLDCITAFIGKGDNLDEFFNSHTEISEFPSEWKLSIAEVNAAKVRITELLHRNDTVLDYQIQLATLKSRIMELSLEKLHFDKNFKITYRDYMAYVDTQQWSINDIFKMKCFLLQEAAPWWNLIRISEQKHYKKILGIDPKKARQAELMNYNKFLDRKYYSIKLGLYEYEYNKISSELARVNTQNFNDEINNLSMKVLCSFISDNTKNDAVFSKMNFRNKYNDFAKHFPVVFSTTHSLKKTICTNYMYDYIIIDEASQVDLLSATVAISCAKNLVVVGDLKQIPNVIRSDNVSELNEIFNKYDLPEYMNYSNYSLLANICEQFNGKVPSTLLNEHYRCDPEIINFCNKRFYNGELIIQTKHKKGNGIEIINSKPYGELKNTNFREVESIKQEIISKYKLQNADVGIITPFNGQVKAIKDELENNGFMIDTIHKFQGKEKDKIILSTVKTKLSEELENDFVNDPNLMNVAISRAKENLFIVSSEKLLYRKGSLFNDLLNYTKYYCDEGKVTEQQVYSIMDLLHDDFSSKLNSLRNKIVDVSEHKSENIIATVLNDILSEDKFCLLKYKLHYEFNRIIPLKEIFDNSQFKTRNGITFTEEDWRFIENEWTHCDFTIFDSLGKAPLLILEVDGKWHKVGKQVIRDERKDKILKAFDITILRINTVDMNCEEKIRGALERCLGIN